MEEKKIIRITKTTFFLLIAIITTIVILLIITTAYYLFQFHKANIAELERIIKTNDLINRLERENDDLLEDINNNNETTS